MDETLSLRKHEGGMVMGHSIRFSEAGEEGDVFELCSISAWARFRGWAASLSEEAAPTLKEFAEEGQVKGTMGLAFDLRGALEDSPPADEIVKAVVETILEHCGVGDPEETATVET